MDNVVVQAVAILAIIVGTAFSLLGVIGLRRLPDVYTRLHATGKVGVFGVVLLTIGAIFVVEGAWARGILLIILLMISAPVVTHAIASAAYRIGIPMENGQRDDLKKQVQKS